MNPRGIPPTPHNHPGPGGKESEGGTLSWPGGEKGGVYHVLARGWEGGVPCPGWGRVERGVPVLGEGEAGEGYHRPGWGTDKLEILPSRRTSYVGGNNI